MLTIEKIYNLSSFHKPIFFWYKSNISACKYKKLSFESEKITMNDKKLHNWEKKKRFIWKHESWNDLEWFNMKNRATIVKWIGKKTQSYLNLSWGKNIKMGQSNIFCFDWISKGCVCGGDPQFETKFEKWWRHVNCIPTQPLQSVFVVWRGVNWGWSIYLFLSFFKKGKSLLFQFHISFFLVETTILY